MTPAKTQQIRTRLDRLMRIANNNQYTVVGDTARHLANNLILHNNLKIKEDTHAKDGTRQAHDESAGS